MRVPALHRTLRYSVAALCLTGAAGWADTVIEDQIAPLDEVEDTPLGFSEGSFIAAPIPFSNPTIGSGLVLGLGYLFQTDATSDSSLIGFGGLKSDNGSYAYGGVFNLAVAENRWKFDSFFGVADVNYDLFTSLGDLPLRQDGVIARASLAYGVHPDLSFGGLLRYLDTTVTTAGGALPPELQPDADVAIATFGVLADWDRRDSDVYPTTGTRAHVTVSYNTTTEGAERNYAKAVALLDGYRPAGPSGVLAARLALCGAADEAPFYDECSIGGTDAFRGFGSTQFFDRRLASLQFEYRHTLTNRLGFSLFAGTGAVGDSFGDLGDNGWNTAGGIGARYRISQKFPVDFAIDYTFNDQNEEQLYIYVGQRF